MARVQISLGIALSLALFAAGCVSVESSVRQPDGTYRTTHSLTWESDWESLVNLDFTSFECHEDHMVATEVMGVTYGWPVGKGAYTAADAIDFDSDTLHCEVRQRTLTINGEEAGTYEQGDTVLITGDGDVIVNP